MRQEREKEADDEEYEDDVRVLCLGIRSSRVRSSWLCGMITRTPGGLECR